MIQHADDSHLLCQSQYYNTDTGVWEAGALSLNKGKEWTVDSDCTSDTTGTHASCSWGWSTTGKKYCDILAGDEEWENARTAFKTYFDATKDKCNVASRWGEWGVKDLYKDWMCKKLKAEHYVYLLYSDTDLPWMSKLKSSLPIFNEIEKYWGNSFTNVVENVLIISALIYSIL